MKSILAVAACAATLCATSASAGTFDLTYASPGGTLSAVIEGTLQGDNNTVIVTGIQDFASFEGVAGPSLPFFDAWDEYYGLASGIDPVLTLDGSFLDFIACTTVNCIDGFGFFVGNGFGGIAGDSYSSSPAFGGVTAPFDVASYSLTSQLAPVPLPASAVLLLSGIGAVAAFRRRRT